MGGMSEYLNNNMIDRVLRGQTFTFPTTLYIALYTATPADSGGGTEVSGGSYARVAVTCSLANWAGTQGAGTTGASSGTGGQSSNNADIVFPTPTANWGTIGWVGVFDASSGGNLLIWGALNASKTVNNGDPAPKFQAGQLTLTFD